MTTNGQQGRHHRPLVVGGTAGEQPAGEQRCATDQVPRRRQQQRRRCQHGRHSRPFLLE